ncbi:MAG: glycosyltransferase [Ruminococcaceae bacterium]|nr:glycosyltransferase [Oscillospiraceae bacterium]
MITIITVCYNAADNLEKTIKSVLMQKNADIEYIIKDGKSTDNTNEIIEKYRLQLEKNLRFIYVSEKDNGIYDAMNIATDLASGNRVIFLNAGDMLYDGFVISNVNKNENDIDILYGDIAVYYQNKQNINKSVNDDQLDALKNRMVICHQAMFIKTILMKNYRYDTAYKICADYDFTLKAYLNEKSFKKINQVISYFNLGGISDRKAFDLIDEAYDIRYKYNLISETEYNNLIRKNEIKKFSRKLIPEKLYIKLKDYKKRYNSRNWDNIL